MRERFHEILTPDDILLAGKRLDLAVPYEHVREVSAEDRGEFRQDVGI